MGQRVEAPGGETDAPPMPGREGSAASAATASMVVRVYASLEALPPPLLSFLDGAAKENFFHGIAWYRAVLQASGPSTDEPRLYVAECQGRPAAVLVTRERRRAGKFRTHMLLGPSHGSYAVAYAPRLDPELGQAGLNAIAAEIARVSPPFHVLRFDVLDPVAPEFAAFRAAWREAGMIVQRFRNPDTSRENVSGLTLDNLIARRSPQMLPSIARLRRRLARSARGRFELVTGGPDLNSALIDYALVDLQSRQDAEPYSECVSRVMRAAASAGALRLGLYYIDDEPAAAQIWIVSGGVATLWRLHLAKNFAALCVGAALMLEMLRHLLAVDRVRQIEFGPGHGVQGRTCRARNRERAGLLVFNPRTLKGLIAATRHIGGHAAMSGLRRLRARRSTR